MAKQPNNWSKDCGPTTGKVSGLITDPVKIRVITGDYDLFIGIDPGVDTGVAIWDKPNKKICHVRTCKIHKAIFSVKWLSEEGFLVDVGRKVAKNRIVVRMEDSRLRKWIPQSKNEKANRGRNQGAGSIKRDCQIWEDLLEELKIDLDLVAPAAGRTKWSADYFKQLTGWTGITSNHGRDAAALVYGL